MLPVRSATWKWKTSTRSSRGSLSIPCTRSAVRRLITGCRGHQEPGFSSQARHVRGEDLDREDPGTWEHSPEWMGSQGGGWGRDAGATVFSAQSQHGNGTVSVTAHAASRQDPPSGAAMQGARAWQEWRTLRFNEATRQSVAKVWVLEGADGSAGSVRAQPECMAMEYLKSMASAAAAILGLTGTAPRACGFTGAATQGGMSVACIGVGGGSLPAFLAHHYPGMRVEAVELDPVVVKAATSAMGFSVARPNLRLRNEDGAAFLARRAREVSEGSQQPIDFLFLDVFDGEDAIPPAFTWPGSGFCARLGAALHPSHGTLIVNMHCGDRPNLGAALLRALRGQPAQLIDLEAPDGREVLRVASLFRDALPGSAYLSAAERQCNAVVVVSRHAHAADVGDICRAADVVGRMARYPFDAAKRAGLGYMAV